MREADFDHILSKEEQILPSSGFAASVMEAVQREAAAPPPIPFPWKRALPGICAACLMIVLVVLASVSLLRHEAASRPLPAQWLSAIAAITQGWKTVGANWIALALILSLVTVKLSMHFASSRRGSSLRT
jgi:hypothetical protein